MSTVPQAKTKSPAVDKKQREWSGTPQEPTHVDVADMVAGQPPVAPSEMSAAYMSTESDVSPEPLVDLDEVAAVRPTIRYAKQQYELKTLSEFGIRTQQKLTRDGREFSRLWTADDELTENELERLEMLLNRMYDQVLDAPNEIKASLNDAQRSQVVLAFTLAPLHQAAAAQQAKAEAEAGNSSTTAS
jgi:hypothetical protein